MSCQILVPVDGSSFGQQALPVAAAIARQASATVHLVKVHVSAPLRPDPQVYFDDSLDNAARNIEESYLRELATSLHDRFEVQARTKVLTGAVIPALETYVRDHKISLVIMSSHGRGGLSRVWLGSVADALVRRIDVPILIVKPHAFDDERALPDHFEHVLIPLDGSPLAEEALAQAVAVADLFGARYTLLQVVNPPFPISVAALEVPPDVYHKQVEQLRSSALAYLDRLAEPLRRNGSIVDCAVIVQSQSAAGILEEASYRGADLLVMATNGKSGYQRVALGSVADKVLRGASTAVLMFRAHAVVPALAEPQVCEVFV